VTVLVATDLDRTMIYSRRAGQLDSPAPPLVEVEQHDGAAASWMTAAAASAFEQLAATVAVVPVTTRVPEQLARVRLPGRPPPFTVASNGGHLYVGADLDDDWTRRVRKTLAEGHPLAEVWEHVGQVCRPEFTRALRNAAGLFCYAAIEPGELPSGFVDDVGAWAAERGWRVSRQGRKLYWVPDQLTKSAAVAEVADRLGAETVFAAGDSLLDVDLLLAADRAIHPRHGELYEGGWSAPTVATTQASGLRAGEEIVHWLADQVGQVGRVAQLGRP
jgi:hypothetical protein